MRALVLGGSGFIGSNLVDKLLHDGWTVRIFNRRQLPDYLLRNPNVEFFQGSFDNWQAVAHTLKEIDVVYHLISATLPNSSMLNPIADIEMNLVHTVHLLDKMVERNIKRIVFFSSGGTVYGDTNQLQVTEDHPLCPICSYGVIKAAIEKYLLMYERIYGLNPIVLRVSNPYGPRQNIYGRQGLVAVLAHRIKVNEEIEIWGDGSNVRDYIYIDDLIRLCLLVSNTPVTGVFNVGSGLGYSILDMINIISRVAGRKPNICFLPARSFDVKRIVLDITKVKNTFGWHPETRIEDGVLKFWNWLSKNNDS